jgi:hypothetical protein
MRHDNELLRAAIKQDDPSAFARDPWVMAILIALGVLIGLSAFGNPV